MGRIEAASLVKLILLTLAVMATATGGPAAVYVGSQVCAGCHAEIYRNYRATAMGRSMDVASNLRQVESAVSVFSEKLNRHFDVYRQGSDIFQAEYELDAGGHEIFRTAHKLEYAIGSGVNGFTYLVRRGNYLMQAPLSYYSRKRSWALSPGYESVDAGFNRPIAAACITCHSGRPRPVRDREGLFADPPFKEVAIGCENCHGPGSLHIAAHTRTNADRTIVNPARLPARLADDICMNCHQGGDTRVLVPGKDYSDFRPGRPLRETLAIFQAPLKRGDPADSDLLEHHSSMQLSRCFRASGGRLRCITCHRIHSMPQPSEAAAYYRGRCLSCHAAADCKLPGKQRLERGDDCAGCHMPKREVRLIAHSMLTNHRILARPDEPLPEAAFEQTTPDLPDLVYLNRSPESKRVSLPPLMLLEAYGEMLNRNPAYERSYKAVLEELRKTAPNQPLAQAALGRMALRNSASGDAAIAPLRRAIELGFTAPPAYQDLAEALARSGREAEAVPVLQRGIELAPYAPALYKLLTLRYIHLKRYAEAKKTLERYVDLFPEDDFMRGLLIKVR